MYSQVIVRPFWAAPTDAKLLQPDLLLRIFQVVYEVGRKFNFQGWNLVPETRVRLVAGLHNELSVA